MSVLPNRDRQAERREATRREILDAAWDLAHEHGIAGFTLRDIAARVGMQAPSLYSHFPSKTAIYDAMFGEAWAAYLAVVEEMTAEVQRHPQPPRQLLKTIATHFFDFAVADPERFQLMNVRVLHGFTPSPEAYAPSIAVYEAARAQLVALGATRDEDLDLYASIVGGLCEGQISNDLGGTRYRRLLDRAMDMYADDLGLPRPRPTKGKR